MNCRVVRYQLLVVSFTQSMLSLFVHPDSYRDCENLCATLWEKYKKLFFIIIFIFPSLFTQAHEIRPAYLEINQTTDSTYSVLWKIPMLNNRIPKIQPQLPFTLENEQQQALVDAAIRQWTSNYNSSLAGEIIRVQGLKLTLIDVLVQINLLDGVAHSFLLQPDQPSVTIPKEPNQWQVFWLYTELGIEHILIGIDHLLFILGLLLLVKGNRILIQTVTAFTVAHSITLALSALDLVKIPQAPVEAVIALSIVFLAREYLMVLKNQPSLTAQYPWIVAFTFGLLHGFGFAGVLSEIGLPQQHIPLALLTFNIGVEIGQLLFIGTVYLLLWIWKKLSIKTPQWSVYVLPYAIGIVASYWLIERIAGF